MAENTERLTKTGAAEFLGITVNSLYSMKSKGELLPDGNEGPRKDFYLKSSLEKYRELHPGKNSKPKHDKTDEKPLKKPESRGGRRKKKEKAPEPTVKIMAAMDCARTDGILEIRKNGNGILLEVFGPAAGGKNTTVRFYLADVDHFRQLAGAVEALMAI